MAVLDRRMRGAPQAKAAVECAPHDLLARSLGIPLCTLFGGRVRDGASILRILAIKAPEAVNIFCHHPKISAAQGAPVESQLMDPVAATAATMLIPKGIRHPHAAALFTDFLLSKDGQKILLQADYVPAHPDVDPSDLLKPIIHPREERVRDKLHLAREASGGHRSLGRGLPEILPLSATGDRPLRRGPLP